jgi:PAS domain S-box-containing protein
LFRALLDAAPDAIVAVDADGIIVLANAQAEFLFGYARDDLIGQHIELLVPESARAVHPSHRRSYFSRPVTRPMGFGIELAGRRCDGSEFPAEISLSSIDTGDGVLVCAAVRDVTDRIEARAERERLKAQAERERLEARMNQSQRLESLGQLAGGVAHDFNNLLAVIINYTTFIAEEVGAAAERPGGERWQVVRDDIEQVQLAAERATELTHQLLAFGRREVVRPRALALNDVVTDVEQLLRRTIGEDVELTIASDADLATVLADRGQIEQVLVNLAVNARDAMPGGGHLTIDTRNVDVDEGMVASGADVAPGRYVRLRVSDTGHGMPRELLEHIFEPFFTTKPKGEGSGLGLATVYGIIAQAGGTTRVYSEPGQGTTFTILLPASDAVAVTAPAHEPEALTYDGQTVLVVEDEDALREVTRRILARRGLTVLPARSGTDAVRIAMEHAGAIDLLLTDVVMPQMLGREVAERVSTIRPGIPVLYMSGYARPVLASRGTLEDDVALLEKPFTEAALLTMVHELLAGRERR